MRISRGVNALPYGKTFDEWVSIAHNLTHNLHDLVLSYSIWLAKNKVFGLPTGDSEQFLQAIQKSPRCQTDPGRYQALMSGEYAGIMRTAHHVYQTNLIDVNESIDKLVSQVHTNDNTWVSIDYDTLIKPYITPDKKVILIDAPLGAGKTTFIRDTFYEGDNKVHTSVLLTCSRTLVKASAVKFDAYDYENVKKWGDREKHSINGHLACCLNSLPNDKVQDALPAKLDLLVIDEIEQTFETVFTGTVDKEDRDDLLGYIGELIDQAGLIVLAQHNITPLTLEFLKYFGIDAQDCVLIKNTHKRFKDLPCNFYQQESALLTHLHDVVGKGERVVVPCNSIDKADAIEIGLLKKYPDLKILKVTSKTTGNNRVKAFLKNPTVEMDNYWVLLHSPVLTSGFSLENDKFKRTIAFITSHVLTPADVTQMMFRNRAVTVLDYFCDLNIKSLHTDVDYINQARSNFIFNKFNNYETADRQHVISKAAWAILDLHSAVLKKADKDKARFFENLYIGLKRGMGCQVNFVAGVRDKIGLRVNKEANVMRKKLNARDLLHAPKITGDEYHRLKDDDDPNAHAKKQRYQFEKTMRIDIGDVPLDMPDDSSQDARVDSINQYLAINPVLSLAIDDYREGKMKKAHLLISEAATSETDAFEYKQLLGNYLDTVYLDTSLKNSFWIRNQLFARLLKPLHLKRENGRLIPTDNENFNYTDVLDDADVMNFCTENREALQACNLTKFNTKKPTVATIGGWLRDMGLTPVQVRQRIDGKQSRLKSWGDFEYPVTRLLQKYNAIFEGLKEARASHDIEKYYNKPQKSNGRRERCDNDTDNDANGPVRYDYDANVVVHSKSELARKRLEIDLRDDAVKSLDDVTTVLDDANVLSESAWGKIPEILASYEGYIFNRDHVADDIIDMLDDTPADAKPVVNTYVIPPTIPNSSIVANITTHKPRGNYVRQVHTANGAGYDANDYASDIDF